MGKSNFMIAVGLNEAHFSNYVYHMYTCKDYNLSI